jgi:hypothetical protein
MNTKASKHPQFGNSVHLVSREPSMIEFVGPSRHCGFAKDRLNGFVLEKNPERKDQKLDPPDQFRLFFTTAVVVLKGWRLEMMASVLANGTVASVHVVEKELAKLMIEEPWVTEIQIELPASPEQPEEPAS